jgi:ribosomal protein S27AE
MTSTVSNMPREGLMERSEVHAQAARRNQCPRCGGNVFLNDEEVVSEWACLQCGRRYPSVQHD